MIFAKIPQCAPKMKVWRTLARLAHTVPIRVNVITSTPMFGFGAVAKRIAQVVMDTWGGFEIQMNG